ncbi:unnamed protein product [Hermetia illucens]|uniref:Uncharacterized protein n=1 Tax=Hermetia illucens TaxID=343691 RepID=A0A7R8YXZ1_HERIL|nr:unnamed protein product [Hermetia illucens]
MGCNTSQEQLQGDPSVIENKENKENQANGEKTESDDNQNVTNREKAEQYNAINATPVDNVDKIKLCDSIIDEFNNDTVDEKEAEDEKWRQDSIRIKEQMQVSKELDEEGE